jgi:ribosomal protein L11 methyltransferase
VVANIIARVLVEMAPYLAAQVAAGGSLILSGIIDSREQLVHDAMAAAGVTFERRATSEDWVALVYRR